jgi:hypothetical protein
MTGVVGALLFGNFTRAQADPPEDPAAMNTETLALAPLKGECDEPGCPTKSVAANDTCALGVMTPRFDVRSDIYWVKTEGRVECNFLPQEVTVRIALYWSRSGRPDRLEAVASNHDSWEPYIRVPVSALCGRGWWYAIATATVHRAGDPSPQQWSSQSDEEYVDCELPDDPPPTTRPTTTTRPCPNPPRCQPE